MNLGLVKHKAKLVFDFKGDKPVGSVNDEGWDTDVVVK